MEIASSYYISEKDLELPNSENPNQFHVAWNNSYSHEIGEPSTTFAMKYTVAI